MGVVGGAEAAEARARTRLATGRAERRRRGGLAQPDDGGTGAGAEARAGTRARRGRRARTGEAATGRVCRNTRFERNDHRGLVRRLGRLRRSQPPRPSGRRLTVGGGLGVNGRLRRLRLWLQAEKGGSGLGTGGNSDSGGPDDAGPDGAVR